MRTFLRIGAIVLGVVGVLVCVAVVGTGWWAAMRTTARVDRAALRLERGLSAVDLKLASIELRMTVVCTDLNAVRGAVETIAANNPELPRIRSTIESLLDRLVQGFDRADAFADSLGSVSEGLRTAADVVDQFRNDSELIVRARHVADLIDRAAESLNGLRARVNALKSVQAVQLTSELAALAREALVNSERLAAGLNVARQEIVVARGQTTEWRDQVVSWIYVGATIGTLIAIWIGLGQLCLIGWGRQQVHI